jgi:hypothetical protein
MATDSVCPKCRDSKHVRNHGGHGWIRCDCAKAVSNLLFIRPNIRCGEDVVPPELLKLPPLALQDITSNGDYHQFRRMVWRSLLSYEDRDLRYAYFDAYRLVEIYLDKDQEFSRVRDLEGFDLIVTAVGVSDLPNRMLAPLLCQLLTQRKMMGLPTWVYVAKTGGALRQAYGNELTDLLGDIKSGLLPKSTSFIET